MDIISLLNPSPSSGYTNNSSSHTQYVYTANQNYTPSYNSNQSNQLYLVSLYDLYSFFFIHILNSNIIMHLIKVIIKFLLLVLFSFSVSIILKFFFIFTFGGLDLNDILSKPTLAFFFTLTFIIKLFTLILKYSFIEDIPLCLDDVKSLRLIDTEKLKMDIRSLLNPAPSSGSTNNSSSHTQHVSNSSQNSTPSRNSNHSHVLHLVSPYDLSSFRGFGQSLEDRCNQIALERNLSSDSITSVTLRDLGISKHSPEYNMLLEVFPRPPYGQADFSSALHSPHYRDSVVWSSLKAGRSPGTSLINMIKEK